MSDHHPIEEDTLADLTVDLTNNDAVTAFARRGMMNIIGGLTTGKKLPEDPKQTKIILDALKALDGSAQSSKRTQVEENAQASNAALAQSLADVIRRPDVIATFTALPSSATPRTTPSLPDDLPEAPEVAGEFSHGTSALNFERFQKDLAS